MCTEESPTRSDETVKKSSPYVRPGMPGYALRCLREATGLTRIEAGELCGMSMMQIRQIEFYDKYDAFVWCAIDARYRMFLACELLGVPRGKREPE